MPRPQPARVCPKPGCPELQPCPTHPPRQAWEGSTRAQRLPKGWQATRRRILTRDHHTCQACQGQQCGNLHLEIDHVTAGDDHSDANLQTLGRDCHRAKTLHEATQARRQAH